MYSPQVLSRPADLGFRVVSSHPPSSSSSVALSIPHSLLPHSDDRRNSGVFLTTCPGSLWLPFIGLVPAAAAAAAAASASCRNSRKQHARKRCSFSAGVHCIHQRPGTTAPQGRHIAPLPRRPGPLPRVPVKSADTVLVPLCVLRLSKPVSPDAWARC